MKKFFFAAATLFAFAAASFATDYVRIDLNYYCRGNLKCLSPRKAGVQIVQKRDYPNGRHPDKCYYSITVNLDLAQEIEVEYEVVDTGDRESAVVKPSIEPIRLVGGKKQKNPSVECLELEINDNASPITPCKVTKWTGMLGGSGIRVVAGDRIIIKAKFKKPAK